MADNFFVLWLYLDNNWADRKDWQIEKNRENVPSQKRINPISKAHQCGWRHWARIRRITKEISCFYISITEYYCRLSGKVNSVQEAWAKSQMLCGSHIKIWNLANHMKEQNKKHQNVRFIDEKLKIKSLMFFISFFHVICKILNFDM